MRKFICATTSTALALLLSNAAWGQSTKHTAHPSATTDESGEILVTAQRRSESSTKVPLSITAQSGLQLEQRGIQNTTDLGKVVPGLTFVSLGAWAQPSLRGVSTTVTGPGNDNPVAIYLDGVYLGQQIGSAFDLPDIERIEVVKGPQGTLFGRNATGGAIQIFTKAPSFTTTGSITTTAGYYTGSGSSKSAADLGVKGYVSGPLSEKLAGSISFHYDHADGYLDDIVRNRSYGKVKDYGARAKLLFEPSDSASFTLAASYNKRDDQISSTGVAVRGLSAAAAYPDGIVTSKPWDMTEDTLPYTKIRASSVSLHGDIELGSGKLTSISSYTDTRDKLRVDADGGYSESCLAAAGCIDFQIPFLTEKTLAQEIYYASDKSNGFSFVIGANAYRSIGVQPSVINDFSVSPPFPGVANNGPIFAFEVKVKTRAYAVFTELNYDVTDRLHLIAGGRFSYETKLGYGAFTCCDASTLPKFVDKSWKNFIGRASVRYDVTTNSSVYATFSQGFKSGVVPYSNFSVPPANPEKINAFEVGYKHGGYVFPFSLSVFYYDYKDLQVASFDRIVSLVNNAATAEIWGADFEGTWRATSDLNFRLGLSYLPKADFVKYDNAVAYNLPLGPYGLTQYTLDLSGHRLLKTPKVTGSFTATYDKDIGAGRLNLTSTLYYSSAFTYDVAGIIGDKAYAVVNAQISFQPTGSKLRYTLFGKNLTNKAYSSAAVPGANVALIRYSAPRQIGVSANLSF